MHPVQSPREDALSRPAAVARSCLDAHRAQDWERLRTLFHPNARIGIFASGGRPQEPETAIRLLREAHSDLVYHADASNLLELDEQAVLLRGSVRYRSSQGGWIVAERSWLYVVRDGLLYRSAMYGSHLEARREYQALGATLGVDD